MSNLAKLTLALLLGLTAAALNWMWLATQARPPEFVAAQRAIKIDDEISAEDLVAVAVPGDRDQLKQALIPYANRAILYGAKATRQYDAGDVFFQRDIRPPLEPARWDVIGPFRLVSVDQRVRESSGQGQPYVGEGRNQVTIAVGADFDEPTRRLLEVLDSENQTSSSQPRLRIVAVQVIPMKKSSERGSDTPDSDGPVVLQTVSLDGIANVPSALLEGDMVRFVVPAPPDY
jgi:hypothetical protein